MSSPPTSTIQITVDGVDVTNDVIFSSARFESQANALPGTFRFTVRDTNGTHSFTTGTEVYLYVDGVKYYGGILLRIGRQFAFPAVDTTDLTSVTARQWVLEGADFNIWFDKRVIRDPTDYLSAIFTAGRHYDGVLIRDHLASYIDVPPGVTIGSEVENLAKFGKANVVDGAVEYAWVTQGSPWRKQMDEFAARTGAAYYLDADKALHYHGLETLGNTWTFVDKGADGVHRVPCREIQASEDGSQIVTDALVWGGLAVSEELLFFSRYPDPPADDNAEQVAINAQTNRGLWQKSELRFDEGNDQESLDERAKYIVMGPPGTSGGEEAGVRFPLWRVSLTWFAHDVPRPGGVPVHLRPGYVSNMNFYTLGESATKPLILYLPLRSTSITFPQIEGNREAWVQFRGEFALSYGDSRHLWDHLLRRQGIRTFVKLP